MTRDVYDAVWWKGPVGSEMATPEFREDLDGDKSGGIIHIIWDHEE